MATYTHADININFSTRKAAAPTAKPAPATKPKQHANDGRTSPEVRKLRAVVTVVDGVASGGLNEIRSLAALALSYLEKPESYRHWEHIANALQAVCGKAEDLQAIVNGEAESVGCAHEDTREQKRHAAYRASLLLQQIRDGV